ncbi:MAG: ABC transporter permease [Sporichthyaceae bacterium]
MSARSVLRHGLGTIALLMVLSLVLHVLAVLAPGDAARTVAAAHTGGNPSEELLAAVRTELGLDRPQHLQYLDWLAGVLQGDFGTSQRNGREVADLVSERIGVSVTLGLVAAVLALVLGVGVGLIGALRRPGALRGGVRLVSIVLASVPAFWLAYLLVLLLALRWDLVPTSGRGGPATWVLPVLVLALPVAAVLSRLVAVGVHEAMSSEYVRASRARGSATGAIVLRDALPNAAGPLLAASGVLLGGLLSGTLIVEEVFAWPGMGALFLDAVGSRDIPVLQACGLFFGVVFVLANRGADLAHALLDPRISERALA